MEPQALERSRTVSCKVQPWKWRAPDLVGTERVIRWWALWELWSYGRVRSLVKWWETPHSWNVYCVHLNQHPRSILGTKRNDGRNEDLFHLHQFPLVPEIKFKAQGSTIYYFIHIHTHTYAWITTRLGKSQPKPHTRYRIVYSAKACELSCQVQHYKDNLIWCTNISDPTYKQELYARQPMKELKSERINILIPRLQQDVLHSWMKHFWCQYSDPSVIPCTQLDGFHTIESSVGLNTQEKLGRTRVIQSWIIVSFIHKFCKRIMFLFRVSKFCVCSY